MSQKEIAKKIEGLALNVEKIYSLQNTLQSAIFYQEVFSVKDFEWAFVLLVEMTMDSLEELNELTRCTYKDLAKESDTVG